MKLAARSLLTPLVVMLQLMAMVTWLMQAIHGLVRPLMLLQRWQAIS